MKTIVLTTEHLSINQIPDLLKEHGVLVNRYAEDYMAHPLFLAGTARKMRITIASLREIGLDHGATLDDIFAHIPNFGLRPCDASAGLFLRLAWTDQPQSQNSTLTGTHASPDQAVTVLSKILESDDDFPKGLYLRNVDGNLWLRGYICDNTYRFPGDALFAFESNDM